MHTLDCNLYLKPSMSEKEKSHSLRRAVELGWDAIIWNTYIAGKLPSKPPVYNPPSATFSRVIERDCLLSRSVISSSSSHTATTSDSLRITQYNRLTVPFDEVVDAQSVTGSTEFARSYDIIAACPMNARVFSYLCKSADIDIIAIDFSHRVPFPLNKKLMDEAVSRGIHFEILYSPLIQGGTARTEVLSGTKILVQFLRGRNIILSSGADSYLNLRGPHDVMNIGEILKLNRKQAMDAVSSNCESVLKHAMARKQRYLPIEILNDPATISERFAEYSASVKSSGNEKTTTRKKSKKRKTLQEEDSVGPSDATSITKKKKKAKQVGIADNNSNKNDDDGDGSGDDDYSNDDGIHWKGKGGGEAKEKGSFVNEDFIRL